MYSYWITFLGFICWSHTVICTLISCPDTSFISGWGCYHIYLTPPLGHDMTQGQFFKRSLTGFNSEFSFSLSNCLTKAKETLPYYLPIAGGRTIGFIPFPRILVLCEMQSVSTRIWTGVSVSIFYDDNHYTTGVILLNSIKSPKSEIR